MHHSMQQRVDGLAALRARSLMATAEFYELIGRPAPSPGSLFQAVAKGKAWHIIETGTGKTRGFRFSHQAAVRLMHAMEAGIERKYKKSYSNPILCAAMPPITLRHRYGV